MAKELDRLASEGSRTYPEILTAKGEPVSRPSVTKLKRILPAAPAGEWAWFQAYYPMTESAMRIASGPDLVDSMPAIVDEVPAALNLCMQIELPTAPR